MLGIGPKQAQSDARLEAMQGMPEVDQPNKSRVIDFRDLPLVTYLMEKDSVYERVFEIHLLNKNSQFYLFKGCKA